MAEDMLSKFGDDVNLAWRSMIDKLTLKSQDKYPGLVAILESKVISTNTEDAIFDEKLKISLLLRRLKQESSSAYIDAQNEIDELLFWYSGYTDSYNGTDYRSIYRIANDIMFAWYEKHNHLINELHSSIIGGASYSEIVGGVGGYLYYIKKNKKRL